MRAISKGSRFEPLPQLIKSTVHLNYNVQQLDLIPSYAVWEHKALEVEPAICPNSDS